MSTVDKALNLLAFFSVQVPERGLSELARDAGLEKATALRLLAALVRADLLEQDPGSRRYRLGPGVLRLARVREATVPVAAIVQPVLDRLAAETGETAHAALAAGPTLVTVGIAAGTRATRVVLDPAEALPYHATASGLAFLAFAAPEVAERVLASGGFARHTRATPADRAAVAPLVAEARARGWAIADQTYEDDVVGIAAPLLGPSGRATGAIAVATPASRMTEEARERTVAAVLRAAAEVTRGLGGAVEPAPAAAQGGHAA